MTDMERRARAICRSPAHIVGLDSRCKECVDRLALIRAEVDRELGELADFVRYDWRTPSEMAIEIASRRAALKSAGSPTPSGTEEK
jgi:hypothetical protein